MDLDEENTNRLFHILKIWRDETTSEEEKAILTKDVLNDFSADNSIRGQRGSVWLLEKALFESDHHLYYRFFRHRDNESLRPFLSKYTTFEGLRRNHQES